MPAVGVTLLETKVFPTTSRKPNKVLVTILQLTERSNDEI